MNKNYRFNRIEYRGKHQYLNDFSDDRNIGSAEYDGYIKCKLAHMKSGSLIVPDQIYCERRGRMYWVQPLFFTANQLVKTKKDIKCKIYVDISFGEALEISFSNEDYDRSFSDGSELYKCKIKGTNRLRRHFTGLADWGHYGGVWLKLFHHTTKSTAKEIRDSGHLFGSSWNIQGTKELENVEYVYFTSLNEIDNDDDLIQIAMASDGEIPLRVDQNESNTPDLTLEVYREDTRNRRHSMTFWVKASSLAPQPIYLHHPVRGPSYYYEIVGPFIHRVGIEPGTVLNIFEDEVEAENPKGFDYMIMGDASTVDGLRAPYDEEETDSILKIQRTDKLNILEYWFENGNRDLFSKKRIRPYIFSDTD